MQCPLCEKIALFEFHHDSQRIYFRCKYCALVFVPKHFHLSPEAEKAEYDKHQNDPQDNGYRKFLSRTVKPLLAQVPKDAIGLDFGCGPAPTVSVMAKERGVRIDNYDWYYFNKPKLLDKKYDFVVMTEVIEHIVNPKKLLSQLDQLLKADAILAIMTKRVTSPKAFATWHYKNDPTHICFYHEKTFQWISQKMGWKLEIIDNDVVFFTKHQQK